MDMKESALEYVRKGLSIIPIKSKYMTSNENESKRPLIDWKEFQSRIPTEEEVTRWWTMWKDANIGLITGTINKLVVADFDSMVLYEKYKKDTDLPNTRTVLTGRPGYHLYFKRDQILNGFKITETIDGKDHSIDIKGEGGYVIAPPSTHFSGAVYEYVNSFDSVPWPEDIFKPKATVREKRSIKSLLTDGVKEGDRNRSMARIAGTLVSLGLGAGDLEILLTGVNKTMFVPPLPQREVISVISSILEYKKEDFLSLVPKEKSFPKITTGFIGRYMEYANPLTEAPSMFHYAMALSVLAAAVGNKRWFAWGEAKMFPNLWFLFLAPSSLMRKTASTYAAASLLHGLDKERLYPNKFSEEWLLDNFKEHPAGIFFWSEFKVMIEAITKSYADAMGLFTDIFDPRSVPLCRRTKQTSVEIESPAISIVTSTPVDWMCSIINKATAEGGFMKRFFVVPGVDEGKEVPVPGTPDHSNKLILQENLRRIDKVSSEMVMSEDAKRFHANWYHSLKIRKYNNPEMESYAMRVQSYSIKFAMLYEISEYPESTTISMQSMDKAVRAVEFGLGSYYKMINNDIAFEKFEARAMNFKKLLRSNHGVVTRAEAIRKLGCSKEEFNSVFGFLSESEQVEETTVQGKGDKKVTVYKLIHSEENDDNSTD